MHRLRLRVHPRRLAGLEGGEVGLYRLEDLLLRVELRERLLVLEALEEDAVAGLEGAAVGDGGVSGYAASEFRACGCGRYG